LAERCGVRRSVYFPGRISELQKVKLLGKSWVSIQPSSFEGWGITVLEANACGTPVIASRVKGLSDSVVDGCTGILVPVKNVDLFAKTMVEVAKNSEFREQLAEGAYVWSKKFSWDASSAAFGKLINNELSEIDKEALALDYVQN
jgi:glycosyltransferase involved in cell wall biosynthesis